MPHHEASGEPEGSDQRGVGDQVRLLAQVVEDLQSDVARLQAAQFDSNGWRGFASAAVVPVGLAASVSHVAYVITAIWA